MAVVAVFAGAEVLPGAAAGQAPGATPAPGATADEGRLVAGRHAAAGSERAYTLFVPERAPPAGARALVVMLHGCTQDAADFMRGTQMNRHAGARGAFVLYPEQRASANPQKCWQWYARSEIGRDAGEVALLADLVRAVVAAQQIDPTRVYVAGVSAGAAMAANLVAAYPELFAAMAVHSGVATGAAGDVLTALAAMKQGPATDGDALGRAALATMGARAHTLPVLVLHGRSDGVVSARNATALVQQWVTVNAVVRGIAVPGTATVRETVDTPDRYRATRERWQAPDGAILVESWMIDELGHAWSGGDPRGTFTDARAPDASALILRFFLDGAR